MSQTPSSSRVIVVGAGLAGLSAAHTVLERGGAVTVLDKKPSFGGNSVKASSGINGADTVAQRALDIKDSVADFIADTTASAGDLARPHLINTLATNSAPSLEWLSTSFGVDLSLVARLGGHTIPRTHRGKGGAPGWAITSALIKKLEKIAGEEPKRVTLVKGAKVVGLLRDGNRVSGVEYVVGEETESATGNVILSTGGFAADFSSAGYLAQHRPDLLDLPTTNGDHSTGDGHRLASSVSASLIDMNEVQVHPTGFVDPANPDAKTKFLAAEALRGVGGLLVDAKGGRFVNEVDRRDFVTEKMQEVIAEGRGPVRLILNEQSYQELKAHCDFYISKGLMKTFAHVDELASAMGVPREHLRETFVQHGEYASGKLADPFGKKHFKNSSFDLNKPIYVALMTPVVHYTMGGVSISSTAQVLNASGNPIEGLFAAGEVIGGVHGKNRLGGSSLLEAVVFGRVAGEYASK